MLELIERQAIKRVGVSPQFHELTNTAQALRYARVALNARSSKNGGVTVFDNSVLAVAAVSAPEVTKKVAAVILGQFDDLPTEEKMSSSTPSAGGLPTRALSPMPPPSCMFTRTLSGTVYTASSNSPVARSGCPMNLPKCAWRSRSAKTCPHHRAQWDG